MRYIVRVDVATVCSYLSLILNCSLIVFGGELGIHPALLEATSGAPGRARFRAAAARHHPIGPKAENRGALRLALQATDASLPPGMGRQEAAAWIGY